MHEGHGGDQGSPVGEVARGDARPGTPEEEAAAVDRLLGDRAILENLPGRVLLVSRDYRVVYVNRATPGRSTADFLGTSVVAHIAEEHRPAYRAAFERAWESGEAGVIELRTVNGMWWEARIAPVKRPGSPGFMLVTSVDVTARKVAERALLEAQKMEAVGQLTAGIAHNFNNLLAIILPNVQLCRTEPGRQGDQRLADVEQAARRASEMVRQLMLFAGHASENTTAPLDLASIASRVADVCRATFDKKIAVRVEAAGDLPPVEGRESQIEQTVLNLCVNARDALMDAPVASPQIVLSVDASGTGSVRIRVADNGPGMTEATRLRVFEPFFTTRGVGHGTGLGLASAYAIVKQHGGKIRCESRPGAGASFEIELPAAEGAPLRAVPSVAPARSNAVTVLVIDDEPLLRRVVRAILEQEGYRVLEAADGVEGVYVFERHRPSVGIVILDRSMPGMSGEEVHARLRAIDPSVPVVLLSGLPNDSWKGARPSVVLSKPADAGSLVEAVRRLAPAPGRS